jgi:K+-sensing histidine kinase KdpD/CheY-like chemotaxis protein
VVSGWRTDGQAEVPRVAAMPCHREAVSRRRLFNRSAAEMLGVTFPFAWLTSGNDVFSFFTRTSRSSIFWTVLATLLAIGCVVYLFQWRYEKKVRASQEQLKTLYELTETFVSSTDPEAIQQKIAQTVPAIADATHCFVLILNPAKQQLEYVAWSDRPPSPAVSLSSMSGPVTCFRNRALTDVPDAEQCPFVDKDVVRRFAQKTLLYAPLMLDRECVGVIEIEDRRRKRIFTPEQVSRIEHVANLSALALRMSDRSSLRDQVHRTDKAGVVKDLLESVAEQLAGPLDSIRSLAESERSESGDSDLAARAKKLEVQAQYTSDALEQVVRLARSQEGNGDPTELNAVVRRIIETQQPQWEKKGLRVDFEPAREALEVSGDPAQLEQVTANVIRRAEDILQGLGGRALHVSTNTLSASAMIAITPGKSVTPRSADPGDQPRPAVSGETSSLRGLRLSVCKSLIEGMGGTLRLDEEAARGFNLEIEYPLAAANWTPKKFSALQRRQGGNTNRPPTALVIDENRETQKELVHQISGHGYRAIPVTTAEEGLDLCEKIRFDWVFCAERVGRLSGLEIYQRLQHRVNKFVLLINEDQAVPPPELRMNGSLSMLRRPFAPNELDHVLRSDIAGEAVADD